MKAARLPQLGSVVWAELEDANGFRKVRPAVVGAPVSSCVPSRPRDIASGSHDMARRRHDMAKAKARPYPPSLLEVMASKTAILAKSPTFS